jgi:hypothetical protein
MTVQLPYINFDLETVFIAGLVAGYIIGTAQWLVVYRDVKRWWREHER